MNDNNNSNVDHNDDHHHHRHSINRQQHLEELERLGRGWKRIQHREVFTASEQDKKNISKTIQNFRAYDFLLRQEEAKRWIETMLDTKIFYESNSPIPKQQQQHNFDITNTEKNTRISQDFFDQLRDGVILCKLANCWMTGEEPNLRMRKYHSNVNAKKGSPLEIMIATDNIHTFFQCCGAIEFPTFYNFAVPDLWERKNIWQVVHCIHALAHFLDRQGRLKDGCQIQDLSNSGIQFSVEEIERAEEDFKNMESMNLKIDFDFGQHRQEETEVLISEMKLVDEDLTHVIDPEQCTIEGRGAETAFAGQHNSFYIVSRNRRGEPMNTGGGRFTVNLTMESNPSIVVPGEVTDLGDGRYEVVYVPERVGRYKWNILLDDKHKLTHKSIKPVRVVPGEVCIKNCVILDPENLYNTQQEGNSIVFHIQARDKCGNNCITGGYKFQTSQLLYFGNNLKNKPINSSQYLTVTDLSNGQYEVTMKNCLPGIFQLFLGNNHGDLVPGLNPFSTTVTPAPVPKLLIKFENFSPQSGVAQFRVTAFDGNSKPPYSDNLNDPRNRENTRFVSVVCTDSLGTSLSSDAMLNTEDIFRTEFVNWVNQARKNIFDHLVNPNKQQMEEDEVVNQSSYNKIWGSLNGISSEIKCNNLRDSLNNKKALPKPVDYVTISDTYVDWSGYDQMLNQKREEQERIENELKQQEEEWKRRREEEERLRIEEEERRRRATAKPLPQPPPKLVAPIINPNQFTVQPRLCAVNFWVVLSNLITDAVGHQANVKKIDQAGHILSYETQELKIKQMTRSDVYTTAKKKDVKAFGDLTLTIAQRYIFEMLEEFQRTLGQDYLVVQPFISHECKKTFSQFAKIHQVFERLMDTSETEYGLGSGSVYTDIDRSMRKKAKTLILGYKRILLQTILETNLRLAQELKRRSPRHVDDHRIEEIEKRSTFFKLTISDIFQGFLKATSFTLSSQPRKIMAQELSFLKPVDLTRNDPASPMVQTKSHSVQIPINSLFDSCLYSVRTNRSTKDRFRPGLVNPYKVAYIKENRVVSESIRTGSLTAIGIEDKNERQAVTRINAAELLRALAANHAKRFTRKELEMLNSRNEPLNISMTSVSLLTPFFLNDREDRQLMEHLQALIEMVEQNQVNSLVIDLYDGLPPLHVGICFKDPCMVNIGTNIVIKTFMLGLGIQRAVNAREYGIRRFEEKVQKFMTALGSHKQILRKEMLQFLNTAFTTNREGLLYKDTLSKRLEQVENAYYCQCRDESESKHKRHALEFELKTKQAELERKILIDWLPYFDQVTSVEITYQTKIKHLVNEIHSVMRNLYKIESKHENRYNEIIESEQLFIKELHNTLLNMHQTNKNFPVPPRWAEYCEFVQKEKDIWDLYSDLRYLYHEGLHEKFTQGIVESNQVKDIDPYAVPVRIVLLSFLIGEQSHFSCKSGKDRTGELHDQISEFSELREQFNEYPKQRAEKKLFNQHRQHVHTNIALNGGSLEIIRQNLGIPGSKADASVSGRFKEGFYQKYKGLSNVDNLTYAPNLDYWERLFNSHSTM